MMATAQQLIAVMNRLTLQLQTGAMHSPDYHQLAELSSRMPEHFSAVEREALARCALPLGCSHVAGLGIHAGTCAGFPQRKREQQALNQRAKQPPTPLPTVQGCAVIYGHAGGQPLAHHADCGLWCDPARLPGLASHLRLPGCRGVRHAQHTPELGSQPDGAAVPHSTSGAWPCVPRAEQSAARPATAARAAALANIQLSAVSLCVLICGVQHMHVLCRLLQCFQQ